MKGSLAFLSSVALCAAILRSSAVDSMTYLYDDDTLDAFDHTFTQNLQEQEQQQRLERSVTTTRTAISTLRTLTNRISTGTGTGNSVTTGTGTASDPFAVSSVSNEDTRDLQSSAFTYRTNYTVEFQLIKDTLCESPPPVINVFCRGPSIEIVRVSHPDHIVCETTRRVDEYTWSYLQCNATCAPDDTTCDAKSIYLQSDGPSNDGPFATIEYSCSSNDLNMVEGQAAFVGSADGVCVSADRRIYHVLRMGVLCPEGTPTSIGSGSASANSSSSTADWVYSYDDVFFECYDAVFLGPDRQYTCADGKSCDASTSCATNVSTVDIFPTLKLFQDRCVQSTTVIIPPAPTAPPVSLEGSTTTFEATFEASWSLLIQPEESIGCTGFTPFVVLQCINGEIEFVSSPYDTMNCTDLEVGFMVCSARDASTTISTLGVNNFVSAQYKCTGPVLPETNVGFANNDASCNDNTVESTVSHALQLGILCETTSLLTDTEVYSTEAFVECGDPAHEFDRLDEFGTDTGDILDFTCRESVTFPIGSTSTDVQEIPILIMKTDSLWGLYPNEDCYTLTRSTPTVSTPSAPSSSTAIGPSATPVDLPIATDTPTDAPTDTPTSIEVVKATDTPTIPPVLTSSPILENEGTTPTTPAPFQVLTSSPMLGVPPTVAAPVGSRGVGMSSETSSSNDSSGFPVAAVVGTASAVVLILGAVLLFAFRRKSNDGSDSVNAPKQPITVNAASAPGAGSAGHDYTETEVDLSNNHASTGPSIASNGQFSQNQHQYPPPQEEDIDMQHRDAHPNLSGQGQMYPQLSPSRNPYIQPASQHPYAAAPAPQSPYGGAHIPTRYEQQQQDPMNQSYTEGYHGNNGVSHHQPASNQLRASFPYTAAAPNQIHEPHHGDNNDSMTSSISSGGGGAVPHGSTETKSSHQTVTSGVSRPPAVEFKDQARSVLYAVPMADVQPVEPVVVQATAVPYQMAPQQYFDQSTTSAATGASRGSDPDGRRDP